MSYELKLPGCTVLGKNALENSGSRMVKMGRKALIVTGKIITSSGILDGLTDCLEQWGISYTVYNEITAEPTDEMVINGVRAYRENACDFLIGIGGGSPLDSAKAIGAMTVLEGSIADYMGREISGSFPPMVMIPTTAGTGSEATNITIITDSEKQVKMLLKGDALLPDLAIIDPAFTYSSPPGVTAATGMDALTHAVEAYTSRKSNPLTDMYALSAVERIFRYLVRAYRDGGDETAREEMSIAAYQAGICINNASVTLVHGMSRPIGALFHVPHGISNAMLLVECLRFAQEGCRERFAQLARVIGVAGADTETEEASALFLQSLEELCKKLNIPTLGEYGICQESFEKAMNKMAEDALASGSPANTIKTVTKEDVLAIYKKLWD